MTNFPEVKDATEIIKNMRVVLTINHTYEHINKKALREMLLFRNMVATVSSKPISFASLVPGLKRLPP